MCGAAAVNSPTSCGAELGSAGGVSSPAWGHGQEEAVCLNPQGLRFGTVFDQVVKMEVPAFVLTLFLLLGGKEVPGKYREV